MSRSAQLWPGPRMRAFFRSILAEDPGVDARLADTLAERLTKRVNRMLVWDTSEDGNTDSSANTSWTTDSEGSQQQSALPPASAPDLSQSGSEAAPSGEKAFDPYVFSIIVVLKRQGAAVLMQRLEAVTEAEHLLQMATAQHIGVDKSITSVKKLRKAIVAGAEQRLADRRAAAS